MLKRKRSLILLVCAGFCLHLCGSGVASGVPDYVEVKLPGMGKPLTVSVMSPGKPTDKEGRLAVPLRLSSYRFRYDGNYFTFNIPADVLGRLSEEQRREMLVFLISSYDNTFDIFSKVLKRKPSGYKFNMTFGSTGKGYPFNWMNLTDKISNIYPNCVPYENGRDVFSKIEKDVIAHEIGHGIFSITGASFRTPGNKALEEGFIDLFIGVDLSDNTRIPISREQAAAISGLTQPDLDISIWGKEAVLDQFDPLDQGKGMTGYVGMTHHAFGKEFLTAYIDVFGEETLKDFLVRLKAAEDISSRDDFGTAAVIRILKSMGYAQDQISRFEKELHKRVKRNIFIETD